MARRSYSRRPSRARSTSRGSYRSSAPRKSSRSRSAPRRSSSRRSSAPRTLRIEVVAAPHNPVSRPEIGLKPMDAPRKAKF